MREYPTEREDKEIWKRNLETKWEKRNSLAASDVDQKCAFVLSCFVLMGWVSVEKVIIGNWASPFLENVKQETQIPGVLFPSALASLNPLLSGLPTWVFLGGLTSVFHGTQINLGAQLLTFASLKQTFLSSMFLAFIAQQRAVRLFQCLCPHRVMRS